MPEGNQLTERELKQRAVRRHLSVSGSKVAPEEAREKALDALTILGDELGVEGYAHALGLKKPPTSISPSGSPQTGRQYKKEFKIIKKEILKE